MLNTWMEDYGEHNYSNRKEKRERGREKGEESGEGGRDPDKGIWKLQFQ